MQITIFVTDDEPAIRSAIVKRLSRKKHRVVGYESGDALLAAVEHEIPDLILLDLKMPGLSGLDTLKKVRPLAPQALIIMLTAYGTVQDAVEAMKLGAYDFLIKTVDLDGIEPVLARAIDLLGLRLRLEEEGRHQYTQYALSNLEANSPLMQQILAQARDVASNGTVSYWNTPRSASTNSDQSWCRLPKNIRRKRSQMSVTVTRQTGSCAPGFQSVHGRGAAPAVRAASSRSALRDPDLTQTPANMRLSSGLV